MQYFALLLLFLTTTCLYMDQQLLAPNLTQIANDFNITDPIERDWKLGGMIGLGFFILGAPAALFLGYLADRVNRIKLFALVVILGSIVNFCTVFVTSFFGLFLIRTWTGVSIGGAMPLTMSLMADYFPVTRRNLASGAWGLSIGIGMSLGQFLAGMMGPVYGWRAPFVAVSLPALVFALLLLCFVEEPARGQSEAAFAGMSKESNSTAAVSEQRPKKNIEYEQHMNLSKVWRIFTIRTNLLAFAQGIPGCVPWSIVQAFLNDYLAQDHKMGVSAATMIVSSFGVGGLVGGVLGGILGQFLRNHTRRRNVALFMAFTVFLSIPPLLNLVDVEYSEDGFDGQMAMAFIGGVVATSTGSNIRAVLLNANAPETRGTVFALFALTDDLGKGLGPMIASSIVSSLGSRREAFDVSVSVGWLLCGTLLLMLFFVMEQDEDALQLQLNAHRGVHILDDFDGWDSEDLEAEEHYQATHRSSRKTRSKSGHGYREIELA